MSLDGRIAPPLRGKIQIGEKGDRKVLEEALSWADATLIGARTLKEHKSICLIKNQKLLKARQLQGKSNQPIAIIVGTKNLYSPEWIFFNQPVERWLLSKKEGKMSLIQNRIFHKKIYFQNTWLDTLLMIKKKGITKIALLGGAILSESLLKEDLIDELQLTITPKILGGKNTWITTNISNLPLEFTKKESWEIKECKSLVGDEIMLRYYRRKQDNDKKKNNIL
tara:strand:- start:217 stop:888 length:672 start_codon:yes stop_codon:yes gene_type:complete